MTTGAAEARRALRWLVAFACLVAIALAAGPARADARVTHDARLSANDGKGEPEVAVNPRDPSNLVAALMSGIVVSHDGGRTWKQTLPSIGGDPTVVADADGRFYAAGLMGNDSGGGPGGVPIHVSTDGGQTWSTAGDPLHGPDGPVAPGSLQVSPADGPIQMGPWSIVACDREFLATDATTGALYASCADHGDASGGESGTTWETAFLACRANGFSSSILTDCGRRYVSVSHDQGKTWSLWYPEDSAAYPVGFTGAFAGIPVSTHGVLATAYTAGQAAGSECGPCAVFETSADAGRTWSRHVVPGAEPSIYSFSPSNPAGGPNSVGGHVGNDSQTVWFEPYVAADPSRPGRYAIMVLDTTRTELLVFVTDDAGATWSAPAVLSRGQAGFRDKPAIAYAPDGTLGVMWKSADPDHGYSFDVWAAVAPAGDTHFGAPVRLSDATSPEQTCGIGTEGQAYTCDELSWMVMDDNALHAVWGDARGGENPWYGGYSYSVDPQFSRFPAGACIATHVAAVAIRARRRVVRVALYANGRRLLLRRGRDVRRLAVTLPVGIQTAVRVVGIDSRGRRLVVTANAPGCSRVVVRVVRRRG